MADVRAALHRLQNVEVTRVPCCTPEVAEKPLNRGVFFVDLSQLSRSIDAVIMSDRENVETGIAPHELYSKSNPGLLKIDLTNPREWYKNGEKILTTAYDKNASLRPNGRQSLESGVRSNGGLLLPSVHNRRNEFSPERSRNKPQKGRSGGTKVFPFLNHVTTVRYTSEPFLNALDKNGNTEGDEGHVDSWADVKENVPDEDQFFEKRNGLPFPKNGGHHSNGTVSDSELEGVVFYQKKKQFGVERKGYRSGGGKTLGRSNHLYPKQRSILHDTINFEQYKLKQKSILKLKFPESDPNQKAKARPYMYNFQYSVPVEPDYSHIQSKIGSMIRPHGKSAVSEEASAPRDAPADTVVPDYSPRDCTPNVKYSFGLDVLTSEELPMAYSTTPSVKDGHYVYKAPGDGYYQRSISHDGTRTAIVNLALGKDVRSTPSEGMTRPFLKGRYRRRKVDSGYTSSTPATEYSSWDERSIMDYDTDEESRSRGQSRANGAGTAASRYANLKSAGSLKSNMGDRDTENRNDIETSGGNQELRTDIDSPTRLDSPSKKSVRFSHAEVKADGLISPSKLGLPRTPGTASSRPKSVLKKFNKIEVFGEKGHKKAKHDEVSFKNSDETVLSSAKPRNAPVTRPPVYKLERPKSVSHDGSSSEKLNSKSGDEDDEYMTRVACLGSPTDSKMGEIVESYRRYLDQGDQGDPEDPTPRKTADADGTEPGLKMGDAKANDETHLGPAQSDVTAESEKQTQSRSAPQGVPVEVEKRQHNELNAFFAGLLKSNSKEGTSTKKDAVVKTVEEGRQNGQEPPGSHGEEARKVESTARAVLTDNDTSSADDSNARVVAVKDENDLCEGDMSSSANDEPVVADQPVVSDQPVATDQPVVSDQPVETDQQVEDNQPVVAVDEEKTAGRTD